MAARRRCPGADTLPGGRSRPCPQLIPPGTRYCPAHARQYEARRGTSTQRGYDHSHRRLRALWAPRVAAGGVLCTRCDEPIEPDEPWDLGHDDDDRTITRGPEHAARCNRSAGGKRAHLNP